MPEAPLAAIDDVVVCRVTGADRLSYLDAVLTQQLAGAPAGTATSALLLDAHGAPLLAVDLGVLEDEVLIVAPSELRAEVDRLLASRTFLSDARFTWADDLRVVRVVGLDGDELPLAGAAGTLEPGGAVVAEDSVALRVARGVLVVTSTPEAVLDDLAGGGVERGSPEDLEAWDVAHGVPAWGHEIAAGHLPEELGLLPTHVHLAKGCYPGQEAVARMWMLGRPRRRLAVVVPDPGVDPGWDSGGGRKGARVTRRVETAQGPRALAFVPSDAEVGDRVAADDGLGVEVLHLAGSDREVVGHDPAMTRRRDRT